MKKLIVYPLAAFGAYVVSALAATRWWIRRAELNEGLDQMAETPAPPVRPSLVEAANELVNDFCRQRQAAADRHSCEAYELDFEVKR